MSMIISISRKQAKALFDFCKQHDQVEFSVAKDHGVYMCGNLAPDPKDKTKTVNSVQYMDGFDPNKDDWYDLARAKFGGDDFGEFLPVKWLEKFLTHPGMANKRKFQIKLTASSIELVS